MAGKGRQKTPGPEALTCIHQRIHWAATPDPLEEPDYQEEPDELDQNAIDHFLDTLVEVALSISARQLADGKNHENLNS